ncbi:MAG: carbohydrate-binding domain-containing protein [Paludibacteraceae bacterium]|nr:carbohydrate-binding domain-containing protein [Paludibacteraceae bacterium]
MKKLLILFYTLIFTLNISAQMSIYFQQGEVDVKVPFVDIDSITFNPVESNYLYTQLRIHNVNNKSTDLTLADIDNIYFKDSDILNPADITTQVLISYNENSISTTNPLAGNGVSISNTEGNVVVTSTVAGVEYILSGTTSNGSFKIYSDFEFKLTLNGATITSTFGPAINIQSSKRVFVDLVDGKTSTLTDSSNYPDPLTATEDTKGCCFSEGQLIFMGNGNLFVNAKAKHAIASDDYIRVISGNLVLEAMSDGLKSNDWIIIDNGYVSINAQDDGIQSDKGHIIINGGTVEVTSTDQGIAASYDAALTGDYTIKPYIILNGGDITVSTTGESAHGVRTKDDVTINGGNINITTTGLKSDGIKANGKLTLAGGSALIQAFGKCTDYGFLEDNGNVVICF